MFFREAPPIPNEEDSDEVSFDNNDYIYDIPDYNNSVSISLSDVNNNNVTMREIKCVKDTPLAYSKFSTYVNFWSSRIPWMSAFWHHLLVKTRMMRIAE